MTAERMETNRAAAIAAARTKLAEALKILEAPTTDGFERRAVIRHETRPGNVDDELRFAKADVAHGGLELLNDAIRAAIEVAR